MNLVRALLLEIERKDTFSGLWCEEVLMEGRSSDEICKHLCGMAEAGLVVFEASRSTTNPDRLIRVMVFDLSWKGHELLDSIRDPKVWKAVQSGAKKVGGLSVEMLRELAVAVAKGMLVNTGISLA